MSGFHALLFITSWLLTLPMTGLPSTFRISHIPLADMSVSELYDTTVRKEGLYAAKTEAKKWMPSSLPKSPSFQQS
ncbi:uncharacterized protein ARMOST_06452 [Armillaria ostoyae]|uniref:Uncharacterized protein n=1 Tax=Armillaria ostoyae TaxID=47428 RepID=A0A284R324_ARMOS|nr:uncharacterized protein ARMOST_06452 [Armillaria ostoyae]